MGPFFVKGESMKKKIIILFLLSFAVTAKNLVPDDYWNIQKVANPQVNSTGNVVAFLKTYIDKKNDKFESEIWVMNSDGTNKSFFAEGSNFKWSNKGNTLAYLKEDENEINQIFIKSMDSRTESKISNFDKDVEDFAWSKDDKFFAFSSFNEYDDNWVVEIPGKNDSEDYNWTDDPKVVKTLHWRYDGEGELESGENHLYKISVDGGSAAKISDWGLDYISDLQFKNENTLIFAGNAILDDFLTPWKQSEIFELNIEKKKLTKLSPDGGVFTSPKISPDGDLVAFIGNPNRDFSSVAFNIYTVKNNRTKVHTKNLSASPENLFWLSKTKLAFEVDERGSANIKILDIQRSSVSNVLNKFKDQFYLTSTNENNLFGVYATSSRPGELATIEDGKIRVLSEFNEIVLSQYSLGKTNEINYQAPDGTDVQGWYIVPPDFDKNKKYPLVLIIHGGPHAMYRPQFNYLWHQFASDGYVVLYTNPRGSTGYGSDFANVIDNDYPGQGDLSDLLAGVDHVTDLGFIDEDNMYVQGCSGGGVLTAWVVGHDDRFAAAASLCPVTNWISMVGTTDIPAWTFEWFDVPFWEDPNNWLDRSPIMRTGYIKTPTLFMTGVLDIRTPMPQTEEMYVALKEAGVDTVLVRMNGEWHGTGRRKPTNWFRTYKYLSEWYEKYRK
ncbi:MAG: S9 family peptidase [SAR86 cluster bacterium]|nr:MAG: S9 family peptidase [SAR86 cluster bacterium]